MAIVKRQWALLKDNEHCQKHGHCQKTLVIVKGQWALSKDNGIVCNNGHCDNVHLYDNNVHCDTLTT